ncbi:shikimate dehydrogenase, partial [Acinetobacter baumannii]
VARHCDTLLPQARLCGSANAVRIEPDGRLTGEMFDGVGLTAALDEAGFAIAGRRVLLVGAGGAARSIAFMLVDAGADLVIANRNL